jgi:hypothetical protein
MKNMNKYKVTLNLKQVLVLLVLMENGSGVLGKSPNYIMEKMASLEYDTEPERLLDEANLAKLRQWYERWMKDEPMESRPAPTLPSFEGGIEQD